MFKALSFSQARFYKATTGRFHSEDNVKGFIVSPVTINRYDYCWNNPIGIVDRDGNFGEWIANAASSVANAVSSTVENGIKTVGGALNDARDSINAAQQKFNDTIASTKVGQVVNDHKEVVGAITLLQGI